MTQTSISNRSRPGGGRGESLVHVVRSGEDSLPFVRVFLFFFSRHVTDDNRFRRRDNRSPSAGSSGPRYKGEDMVRFPGYASVSPPTVAEKDADLGWLARGGFDRPYRLTSCSPRRLQTYARMTDVGYIRDKVSPSLVFSAHCPAPPLTPLSHSPLCLTTREFPLPLPRTLPRSVLARRCEPST